MGGKKRNKIEAEAMNGRRAEKRERKKFFLVKGERQKGEKPDGIHTGENQTMSDWGGGSRHRGIASVEDEHRKE